MTTETLPAGWAEPIAARKAHYFQAGHSVSVCGRWMYTGERDTADTGSPYVDNCNMCLRKFDQIQGANNT